MVKKLKKNSPERKPKKRVKYKFTKINNAKKNSLLS